MKSLVIQPFFFNISESAQEARPLGGLSGLKDRNFFARYCIQSVRSLFLGRKSSPGEKKGRGVGPLPQLSIEDKVIRVCGRKYLIFVSVVVFSIDFCRDPSDFAVA